MALPMLQVGAVLTNLVCTKVPILARPHCYRDNADRYPHKFKCCPYNYVFVNYDRICSCVPKKYAQTLRNEQRYRQQKYNSPSYQKTGYRRVSNYGSQRSKNYGYATKSSTKQSRYRQTPSLNARRKGSYPEPSESISNSVKVTSIKRRYKQNSNPVKFKSIRRKTTSNSLKRTQHVPTNTKSRRNNLRQRPRKDFTNMRINSVKIPKKTVSKVPQKRVQVKTQILSSAKVHDRQTKPKSDNSDKKLIRNVGSSIVATNQRKGSRVKHISPPKRTSASFVKNAKSTKKNLPSEFRQRQYKENVSKIKNIKNDVINHVTQTLISDTKTSQSSGNIPIYYLIYNLKNGIVVQMPVIYEYHVVLPQGIDRAIPMPGNKGYLVPISIYVATSGRFVFNPVILRRHPSLLSHIRLARQRGISIKPIPLRQDTIQSNELSTYLNARSHQFDDILIDHPVPVDPLHDVVPLEAQDHAPQSHFIGVNHRHIDNNVQRQNNGVVFGFDNTQNQPKHFPHSRVVKHSKDKTSQPFENINTFFDNATLNGLPNRNSIDPKLQSLRVLSNKDFVDKSSRIKQTFNPNWIPNLDLFQMLTNGQRLNENHPTHIQSKQNIQKTFKNHYVDLHNIISNIPLDSHFDLKTDILGRPIPDIPGPLSLRRQSQGKNHRLHFSGTHKGPVGFPSNNSPPRRAEIMLPETLHLVNTGIPQISESSVPLASSGFADVNVAKSFITKLAEQRMSKRNPTETISVIQKDPFLTKQNKMTLKFQGPETQNLNHQLSNPLAGIAGSTNSMTPIETTLHTGKGTGNIVVQTETGKNATTLAKTITHIGKINANIKGSSNMIGNNIGAFEIPIVQTKTRNTKLQNMLIGNVAKVLDPLSVLRNNQKTLKTTNGLTGTNTKKLIQTMINGQASNLPNSLHGMENPALMNSLLGGSANNLTNLKSNLLGQTGVITNPIAGVEHTASNINPLKGGHARSSTNIQTGLHVKNGTLPNSLAGVKNTALDVSSLSGKLASGSSNLQTSLGHTGTIPNPLSGLEHSALNLNVLTGRPTTSSSSLQANLMGQTGGKPNPLSRVENAALNLNVLTGKPTTSSSGLLANLKGQVVGVPNPLSRVENAALNLNVLTGRPTTSSSGLLASIQGMIGSKPNPLSGIDNAALNHKVLTGKPTTNSSGLLASIQGMIGSKPNLLSGIENTVLDMNSLMGGPAISTSSLQTNLQGQTGSIPNPSAGMAKTDAKLDALMGRSPAGSTALQTNLQGLTSSIPNPFSGTENTAIKLNLLKEGSSSNSKNSQTNLQGRIGHIPNPLVGANNPTVNLNTLVGRLQVPSTNLQTNVHGKMGHSPNPMAGIKATTAIDLNQLKGLPTSSAANSVGKTDHLPNSVSGIETPAVKFNTLFDIPASNSMKLQTNLQRLIGSIPNPLAGTAKTVANVNALLGSPKSQTNVQGQSGPISNPKAIHDHTAVKHDQGMRSPAETSVKLQLDLQTQSNGIPNTVSNIKNAAVTMNRFHVTHQPVASSTKLIKQIGNLPNPMTGMGKTAVKLRNSNRKPETSTGTMHKLQRQTNNPPNPLSEFGNTAPKSETLIGIGQPALNSVHLELNSPRHTGNVKNLLSGMGNNAVVLENPIGQSEIGITNTFEQLNGHARVIPPQSASVGRINSGLTDNSLRNRMFLRENVNMPIQSNKFKKIPFNPRLLAKQNPFTYRTFFNLSPNGPNTGSSSDRNGVIGIINGNTKIYPIPIFPGAINTKMGEPVFQTGNGFDIFSGQEFSPFIDPTTNLPVGFTVKKFNNEVGGVVDLLQKDKPMASDGRKTINVRAKQPKKENGVIRFLQNDAVIKEIVTVLRRKKKTLGPNKNELFIPPEIIGEKSRNDIVMYLEDVKSSKSLSRKPSNDSVPKDLVKLLKNPVFVRYIDNKTQETTPNTVDLSDPRKLGLIFDRISGSRKPTAIETKTNMTSDISFTKSNTKVLNSKSKESMVFLTAKTVPPLIQKPDAEVLFPADPVITLPPVPVLKFDSIELNHQKPLKMNLTKDLCQGCIIDGGLGYANHPSSCERFIVCYPGEGGKLVPIEQQCPHGLFWSQKALTCRLPKDVLCPYDICLRKKGKHQYPHEENCLSYWECQEGYSVPKCCPSGTSFKEGQGCVSNDGSCKSRCPLGDSEIQPVFWQGNFVTSLLGECDRRAVPGSRNKFERHVYYQSHAGVAGRIQQEWMLQECSPGTEFHPEVCDCRVSGDPAALNKIKHVCLPDVYLPFTHNLKDESSSRTHVRADNVSLATSGSACFIGRSALAMPKFANMELGSYLYVKLTYRHMSSSPKNEVLVYNGDCERKPSLILGSTADGNFVSVVTTSGEQHTLHVKSSVPASEWRTVSLVIDNGHIRVTSDSQTEEKNTFGVLERAPCGLKLGWGEGYENFNGCIDEFTLYRCRPDGPLV
eukprot:XP_011437523.1 PREDICTED: uncharacterized protein LOC105335381 isoform X1 [Crassostrea gigas]